MTVSARRVALDLLRRIEAGGAYANVVTPRTLDDSVLSDADRRFVTDLVYGTTRMRRACDAQIDRFVATPPDPAARTLLRLGAYQLLFGGVAPHAAVSETVGLAPKRLRGFVNAVLRKIAATPAVWASESARLSYPDWIVERLVAELGRVDAIAALERMNEPPPVTVRDDGYTQDRSSQWVAAAVDVTAGCRVLDVCAAPGGKATALANRDVVVIAADVRVGRARLVAENVERLGLRLPVVVADGSAPPFRPETFEAVLVDAPCSGLGALRRRPDARWRVELGDVTELTALQARLIEASAPLVKSGGQLVYSVCTLTDAESVDHTVPAGFELDPAAPEGPWRPHRGGWRLLPQDADSDGMVMLRYRRTA